MCRYNNNMLQTGVLVLLYLHMVKVPKILCLPFCSPLSSSVLHWLHRDVDWRAVAVTGVLPLGCSNASLHTVQSQERSSRERTWESKGATELDQVPGLYTNGFLLWLCIDRHCRCLPKCFNVMIRPETQPLMLGTWNWNLLKLHLLAKCISSVINFYTKLCEIIKHRKWWQVKVKKHLVQRALKHITHLIIIANIPPSSCVLMNRLTRCYIMLLNFL